MRTYDLDALVAKKLPRCTFALLSAAPKMTLVPQGEATPEEIERGTNEMKAAINEQVRSFIPPQKECIGCGEILASSSLAEAYMRATFVWGMANGEGHCASCGYPARAVHRPRGETGLRFNRVLQYHPEELTELRRALPVPVEAAQ